MVLFPIHNQNNPIATTTQRKSLTENLTIPLCASPTLRFIYLTKVTLS